MAMTALLTTLIGALLAAHSTTALPTRDGLSGHVVQKRSAEADNVLFGLIYAKNMLLSCHQPSLLPEVSGVNKTICGGPKQGVSETYKSVISALDKVLRLHDLQQRLALHSSNSTEARALQIVVDTVVNQTCDWIESLAIHFSGDGELLTCNSSGPDPMAQIKKLHVIVSTYQLLYDAESSTKRAVGSTVSSNPDAARWLNQSGVRPELDDLLTNTVYAIHLSPGTRCMCM